MSNRFRPIALVVAAALVALGVGAGVHVSAQNTDRPPRGFGGGPMGPGGPGGIGALGLPGPLAQQLGVSDAQKDQIKGIVQSHNTELKALGDRARTARQALDAAMSAEKLDDAAIRQASAEVSAVQADMAVAQAHIRAEIVQVLTPEQKAKLKQLQAQMRERGPRGRR